MNLPDQGPTVSLIFPPLVDTNFGNYYPSTAVLAGYLLGHGIHSAQLDLNEEFALHLLDCERLTAIGAYRHEATSGLDRGSPAAAAARLLLRTKQLLFDDSGRHRFRIDSPGPGHLLSLVAEPFRIDRLIDELVQPDFLSKPISRMYQSFYHDVGMPNRIGDSVRLVGISVAVGPQLAPALILSELLAAERPDLVVVVGGPTFSLMDLGDLARVLRAFPSLTAVVRFDGEQPLLALVQQVLADNIHPEEIPGVSCRVATEIVHCPPARGARLDDIPFAHYDPALMARLAEPEVGITQARGCYWGRCAYCDFVELYDGSPAYRTRTVRHFVDEMASQQARLGDREFSIITESIPAVFARKVSEEILERGLRVRWNSFAMVDHRFTPEVFEVMAQAGCTHLCVGVESMTDRVLTLVKKAGRRAENLRFLRDAHAAGIGLKINLIPNLPSTTYAESIESLAVFRECQELVHSVSIFPFEPTRSSAIGREPEAYGLVRLGVRGGAGQSQFASNHLASQDPAMSAPEQVAVIEAYRRFADEVNARVVRARNQSFLREADAGTKHFRINTAYIDLEPVGTELLFFHWATKERLALSSDWWTLVGALRDLGDFTPEDLAALVGDQATATQVMRKMQEHGIVAAAN